MSYVEALVRIKTNIAALLGKSVDELVPGKDYDPITIDGAAWQLVNESNGRFSNWTGD